jgi:hypothetical protein
MRQLIGEMLAGDQAAIALAMLDSPDFQADKIEETLATNEPKPKAPTAKPAQPQHQPQTQTQKQTQPTPGHKPHYRDWKAAKLQKKLQARAARAGPDPKPP